MDDEKIVSFEAARREKEKKSDAATLVRIGRLIDELDNQEAKESLLEAWSAASAKFFASPTLP